MKLGLEIIQVVRTFRARPIRATLTILGILIGVAGVVTVISVGAGAQSLILSQVNKLGSNIIGVLPGKSNENGPPAAVFGITITTLNNNDAKGLREKNRFPHIEYVAPLTRGAVTVTWKGEEVDTQFTASSPDIARISDLKVAKGRFFDDEEDRGGAQVVVLGSDVAKLLFNDRVDPIGQVVKVKNVPMQVVGVMAEMGVAGFFDQDDQVYIPLVIGQKQILGINHLLGIRMKIDASENIKPTIEDVKTYLREQHKIEKDEDDDFSVRDLADAITLLSGITGALRMFLAFMAAISLVVGGIGIMNIMLVTVAERTREIGLRKALGATTKNIRSQFLLEAVFVTLLGGVCGIVFGALLSYVIALGVRYAGYEWAYSVSPLAIVLAVGVSAGVGIIFGLYPAFKASKLNPIVALQYE